MRLSTLVEEALRSDLEIGTDGRVTVVRGSLSDLHEKIDEITEHVSAPALIVHVDGRVVGAVAVDEAEDPDADHIAATLAVAADQLQDHVIDALNRAWPPCPLHSHPLEAEYRAGAAIWVCPHSDNEVSRIGV